MKAEPKQALSITIPITLYQRLQKEVGKGKISKFIKEENKRRRFINYLPRKFTWTAETGSESIKTWNFWLDRGVSCYEKKIKIVEMWRTVKVVRQQFTIVFLIN